MYVQMEKHNSIMTIQGKYGNIIILGVLCLRN